MDKLRFGTAGIPISCSSAGGKTLDGVRFVRKLGLECMELEFVRSINIGEEMAEHINLAARQEDVILTCHAPYYINLNSLDKTKTVESAERILRSAKIADICGCRSLTFHAGFHMGMESDKAHANIKVQLEKILNKLKSEGNRIMLRPEITGKPTQFGSLEELIILSQELSNILPCIDFAHLYARSGGRVNGYEKTSEVLARLEEALGRNMLDNMHSHVSGIAYGPGGERNHLTLEESGFDYMGLLKALADFRVKGVVISESPNIEQDAMMMKKLYEEIKR